VAANLAQPKIPPYTLGAHGNVRVSDQRRYLLLAVIALLINAFVILGWRWLYGGASYSYNTCIIEGMKDQPSSLANEVFDACAKRHER
jgi:hypothetical protein